MKRLEVIANQSVKDELLEALGSAVPELEYTLIPTVQGSGRSKKKFGTRTWPETNFLLVSYMGDAGALEAKAAVADVARRFPGEGIYAAISEAESIIGDGPPPYLAP
jgi:hydrophobic/amphiphilic exporter-1 (mainly G- bacteria), HAE1 family